MNTGRVPHSLPVFSCLFMSDHKMTAVVERMLMQSLNCRNCRTYFRRSHHNCGSHRRYLSEGFRSLPEHGGGSHPEIRYQNRSRRRGVPGYSSCSHSFCSNCRIHNCIHNCSRSCSHSCCNCSYSYRGYYRSCYRSYRWC